MKDHEGIHHDQNLFRSSENCKQIFDFTTGVELHKQLACSEMPVSVFLQAMYLAQKEEKKGLNFENHPSVRLLCDWWDEHNPGRLLPAAFFFFHARFKNNNVFFDQYRATPVIYAGPVKGSAGHTARVSNFIIIEFFASIPFTRDNDDSYYVTSVDGKGIGHDLGYIHDGFPQGSFESWHSLRYFTENFSQLTHYLSFLANAETKSTLLY